MQIRLHGLSRACIALAILAGRGHAECRIADNAAYLQLDYLESIKAEGESSSAAPVMISRVVRSTVRNAPGPRAMGIPATGSTQGVSDARRAADAEILRAIRDDDVPGLTKALPTDAVERRASLRRLSALATVFDAGALSVARKMLEWDPNALVENYSGAHAFLLERIAQGWLAEARDAKGAGTLMDPAVGQRRLALMRLLMNIDAKIGGGFEIQDFAQIPESNESLEAVRLLLGRGASINGKTLGVRSALSGAAEQGNARTVRMMLEQGAPTQESLDQAIRYSPFVSGNQSIALLLERGARLNLDSTFLARYTGGQYLPAWSAASEYHARGERELIDLLIRYRVDPNPVAGTSNSALMNVVSDPGLVRALLALGADARYKNNGGDTALHRAADRGWMYRWELVAGGSGAMQRVPVRSTDQAATISMLLDAGADARARNSRGQTAFSLLSARNLAAMELLSPLLGPEEVNRVEVERFERDGIPMGPVSWALVHQYDAYALSLSKSQPTKDPRDCGAVWYAARGGSVRTLALLLDRSKGKVQTDLVDSVGRTPLMAAAMAGHTESVRMLLDRGGVNVDETVPLRLSGLILMGSKRPLTEGGETALMLAARSGEVEVVKVLLAHGASVNRRDIKLRTALEHARFSGEDAIAQILIDAGAR